MPLSTCYREHRDVVTCLAVVRDWVPQIRPRSDAAGTRSTQTRDVSEAASGAWVANVATFGTDSGEALRGKLGSALHGGRKPVAQTGAGEQAAAGMPAQAGDDVPQPALEPLVVSGDMAGHVHVWMPIGQHGGRVATLFLSLGASEDVDVPLPAEPVTAVAVNSRLIAAGGCCGTVSIWARKRYPREFSPVPVVRRLGAHSIVRALSLPVDPPMTSPLPLWTGEPTTSGLGIDSDSGSGRGLPQVAPIVISGGGSGKVTLWIARERFDSYKPGTAGSTRTEDSPGRTIVPSFSVEEKTLQSHDARVTCLAIDGYRAVSAGADGSCHVYDVFGH